jgi:hypothetical protein
MKVGVVGEYSPKTHVLSHKSHRTHPVIGHGLGDGVGASPADAWFFLGGEQYIEQLIPGIGHEVMSLGLVPGQTVTDPSSELRWPPKKTRRFVLDMAETNLVTQELADALLSVVRVARKRGREAIPAKTDTAVLAKTTGKCVYCGVVLTRKSGQPNTYHRDHVLAKINGGTEDVANLIPACRTCNLKKGAKPFIKFVGAD